MDLNILDKEELIEIIQSQKTYIQELEIKLTGSATPTIEEKPAKATIPGPVNVEGALWKFRYARFKFGGKDCRADEALYDTELMKKIISTKYQTIMKKVN